MIFNRVFSLRGVRIIKTFEVRHYETLHPNSRFIKNLSEKSGEWCIWQRFTPPHTPTRFIFRIDTK